MPGLDPSIHDAGIHDAGIAMDCRIKPGHDETDI